MRQPLPRNILSVRMMCLATTRKALPEPPSAQGQLDGFQFPKPDSPETAQRQTPTLSSRSISFDLDERIEDLT
jgi:hypothetical protein